MHNNVIQSRRTTELLIAAHDRCVEQEVIFDHICTTQNVAQLGSDLLRGNVGQKAEPTPIDPNDWNTGVRKITADPQQAAISANNHDEVATTAQILPRDMRMPRVFQHAGGIVLDERFHAMAVEAVGDRHQTVHDARISVTADQSHSGK